MRKLEFTIHGRPQAKGRARVTMRGGFARAYSPKSTKDYEIIAAEAGRDAMCGIANLFEGALSVRMDFVLPIPVSKSKKAKAGMVSGEIKHIGKPDCSNLVKGVEDALNGVCWHDDSQITDLRISKRYGDNPRVEIIISEVCA